MEAEKALVSPFSGILGDKFNRIHIVALGTFLWGVMTAAIGLSTTLSQVGSLMHMHFHHQQPHWAHISPR